MVCEKVIGKLKDVDIAGKTVEYVDIEWHEAFKKIHRKVTGQGCEVGIRMDDSILTRGLLDRKSTRLNSSHTDSSRMPSSA